jgi:micrococcal nuclease
MSVFSTFIKPTRQQKKMLQRAWFVGAVIVVVISLLRSEFTPSVSIPVASPLPSPGAVVSPSLLGSSESTPEAVLVTRIIDGDTIEIEGGQRVRYIGIDSPERSPSECQNQEATNRNTELVLNQTVTMEKDVSDTDRYGRLLRYVYVRDQMVNEVLVREGFAVASSYPPDIKHQALFTAAQDEAVQNMAGLWGKCE